VHFGIFSVSAGRQSGGPETYERCLVRSLLEIDPHNQYTVFCMTQRARGAFDVEKQNLAYRVIHPNARWISAFTTLPWNIRASGVNLLHATVYAPPFSPASYVFTMHCFSSFARPEFYPRAVRFALNRSIRMGLQRSRLILCVSQNVRDHVAETFKISSDRLAVVYNGVGEEFTPVADARNQVRSRYGISRPFILFAGQLKARKNVVRLIKAFAALRRDKRYEDLLLVLAGRRIATAEGIDDAIDANNLRSHVLELGHRELVDLPALYSAAELFAFPSLWEGFGIPIIEAMACGTPVVTSNISCMPEIAGKCAVLVDPHSEESIADGMDRVLSSADFRQQLTRAGQERARLFSWKRTAEQTLQTYQMAAAL
jgi:glycosyltransferase involved in cell wall biosynthesis